MDQKEQIHHSFPKHYTRILASNLGLSEGIADSIHHIQSKEEGETEALDVAVAASNQGDERTTAFEGFDQATSGSNQLRTTVWYKIGGSELPICC